ncbi:glucosamine-6-phosphate deaminase [Enterococcus ureasiticus]|uniref:Glucosamine-6-phosphate deaminase n=1 Tax=Enterococcus ureasiticus TaxID=903984 RepID=A0A1E5GA76_9ENTE|nr:glucosamine-6-phosphate deaminase [Enterococcus ureasiticus]OEG09604.1 glucosamine-6-phosphate deaminase [Enterococcus ureasiticus]
MNLNYSITENYDQLSKETADMIIEYIKNNPRGLYCFAGGDTPVGTLKLIAEEAKLGNLDLSQAHFIELDEWVGLDPSDSGSCASYLTKNLFTIANIKEEQIHTFNPLAENLQEECEKANQYITKFGGLSLTLLGVGVNGHLGFNEPGVSFENRAHIIDLDQTTQEVGKKYFAKSKNIDRSKGITLGIKQLLNSDCLIVQASGARKKAAIKQLLKGEITNQWPVTAIWKHKAPIVIIDKDVLT